MLTFPRVQLLEKEAVTSSLRGHQPHPFTRQSPEGLPTETINSKVGRQERGGSKWGD